MKGFRLKACAALLAMIAGSAFGVRSAGASVILNFANIAKSDVSFSGGAFTFDSAPSGYQFAITSESGGTGDAVGLQGYVTPGGPFSIGPITISGPMQTASVSGTGTIHITDSSSVDLTGTVQWDDITTIGVGGILDLSGTINLTAITYPGVGTSADLHALAAADQATDVITFQFVPAQTLTQLKADNGAATSYSGSIVYTPEPSTIGLLGTGLVSLLGLRRRAR